MLSCVIATKDRENELLKTLSNVIKYEFIDDIIIVNDGGILDNVIQLQFPSVKTLTLETSHGPGKAKLAGIKMCKNNHVLIIDDDIDRLVLPKYNYISEVLEKYALVQGKIYADSANNIRKNEQPFLIIKNRFKAQKISYFVGAIHLVDKLKFIKCQCYTGFDHYGFEELEASIKLLKNGNELYFDPEINIIHLKTASTRDVPEVLKFKLLRNRYGISNSFPFPIKQISKVLWKLRLSGISFKDPELPSVTRITWVNLLLYPRLFARAFF